MEEVIKQDRDKDKHHKEFKDLLSQDLSKRKFKEGELTIAVVSGIGKKFIFVDLGLKSEGAIPIEEFKLSKEIDNIKIGSKIEVLLEKIENKIGNVVVSREKARKVEQAQKLCRATQRSHKAT